MNRIRKILVTLTAAFMVFVGGLFRFYSLVAIGMPSLGHRIGLGIELVELPLLLLWQARVARRFT